MDCERVQWKALPKDMKDRYEERARVIAVDSAAKKISETSISMSDAAASASDSRSASPHPGSHMTPSGTLPALFIYYSLLFTTQLVIYVYFPHCVFLSAHISQQEGLAVASIARDDPSTLHGDDAFPRATCTTTAMCDKLGSEFET